MKILGLLLLAALLYFPAFAQTSVLSKRDEAAVRQVEKDLEAAFLKDDEKAVMALVWDDAIFYPNGNAAVKGVDAIRKFWFPKSDSVHTLSRYDIRLDELYGERNLAVAIGVNDIAFASTTAGKPGEQRFTAVRNFVSIYQKRHGVWKIFRRHWNGKLQEVK